MACEIAHALSLQDSFFVRRSDRYSLPTEVGASFIARFNAALMPTAVPSSVESVSFEH